MEKSVYQARWLLAALFGLTLGMFLLGAAAV